MNKEDKDILSDIADTPEDKETITEDDDVLINGLFAAKGDSAPANHEPAKKPMQNPQKKNVSAPRRTNNAAGAAKPPVRNDARYTMTEAEIETLATAVEDAVADGRFGAALDSVFFTAGAAREALREKLNIRIPIGSADTDLPVISAAALIESYLGNEEINGADIEEKLQIIIESSEDERGARPSADQVDLRVFECALILCAQAEQCGKHDEIKRRLYINDDSFLRVYLAKNIDHMLSRHRKELHAFAASVKLQSRAVSHILDEYMASSKNSAPFLTRFFAESKPVMITAIVTGVLCLISIIVYFVTYGNIMSFIATDSFIMGLVVLLEILFCLGMLGVSTLVYMGGESKADSSAEK